MRNEGELTTFIKRTALWVGIAILITSIFLSFDGFDGKVSGGNPRYSLLASLIGLLFALAVTILQFIFTSSYRELNTTLKVVGLLSYVYSIYTNKLGAQNILQMDETMSWVVALFSDIVAEPMIAWGLGESLVGDLLGNIGNIVYGKNHAPKTTRHQKGADFFNMREESEATDLRERPESGFRVLSGQNTKNWDRIRDLRKK